MNLTYFEKVKYEGTPKAKEGGRFAHWNPANEPISFLVVGDPASIVKSKRKEKILKYLIVFSLEEFPL